MSFVPPRSRPRAPSPPNQAAVLAVGQVVFVHAVAGNAAVVLTDEAGNPISAGLADGAEVRVVGWRPRGSTGIRYRVRVERDGSDGWLAAGQLRASTHAVAEPAR